MPEGPSIESMASSFEQCSECARLWQEFANRTNEHLRVLGQQQIAVIQRDADALERFGKALAESAARRLAARNAFKAHAAIHAEETGE
jgi:hypothetical protein